jgi:hypothetical protein
MANFYVTNSRFPSNPQLFTVNLTKASKIGGEVNPNFNPTYPTAESYWTLFVYTTGTNIDGEALNPVVLDILDGAENIKDVIETKISQLCSLIDWTAQGTYTAQDDVGAPIVYEQSPSPGEIDVPISSVISLRVQDTLAGVGIDQDTISLKINGIEVTPVVTGNKFDMTITYRPRPVYF